MPNVLVLSTADWDAELWTNKQFAARELAKEFQVWYVESMNLRRPTLRWRDGVRAWSKVLRAIPRGTQPAEVHSAGRSLPEQLSVLSPLILPFHAHRAARAINRFSLQCSSREWRHAPARVLWTYSAETYGLEKHADAVVYHCVDFLAQFPGIDSGHYSRAESSLAQVTKPTVAIASSRPILDHLHELGFRETQLLENVADTSVFASAVTATATRQSGRVVFAGNLSGRKVDLDLILQLSRDPEIDLHVAGPTSIDGSSLSLRDLRAAGATLHGTLAPEQLALLLATAAVGIIPYVRNSYTDGVFPLKVYEYLAAGLVVLSTPLPALLESASPGVIEIAEREEFVEAVRARRQPPRWDEVVERQHVAGEHSWERRGSELREIVRSLL